VEEKEKKERATTPFQSGARSTNCSFILKNRRTKLNGASCMPSVGPFHTESFQGEVAALVLFQSIRELRVLESDRYFAFIASD
jgi:hypothetical protein